MAGACGSADGRGGQARGLTTAASLLATAAVGVACGLHLYLLASCAALLFLFTLWPLGRLAPHLTGRRSPDEVAEAWRRDPVVRLRACLTTAGAWDKAAEDALLRECNEQVQAAAQAYLDTPAPLPEQMFDHLYAAPPPAHAAQYAALLEHAKTHGTDHAR